MACCFAPALLGVCRQLGEHLQLSAEPAAGGPVPQQQSAGLPQASPCSAAALQSQQRTVSCAVFPTGREDTVADCASPACCTVHFAAQSLSQACVGR